MECILKLIKKFKSSKYLIGIDYLDSDKYIYRIKILNKKRNNVSINGKYYSLNSNDLRAIKEHLDIIDIKALKPSNSPYKVISNKNKKKTVFKEEIRVHLDNEFVYVISNLKLLNNTYVKGNAKKVYKLVNNILKILNESGILDLLKINSNNNL